MVCQDNIEGRRHKEVCVLMIGLMHVDLSIYFYYLLLFFTYVLLLDKLRDLLLYYSLRVLHCISAELLYVY